jgi:hypothetical protein
MRIGRGSRSTWRKPALMALCPPKIPHDLTQARTLAAAVGTQGLTAWAMALPHVWCHFTWNQFKYFLLLRRIFGTFMTKLKNMRLLLSLYASVSVENLKKTLNEFSLNLMLGSFTQIQRRHVQIFLKSDNNNKYCTWRAVSSHNSRIADFKMYVAGPPFLHHL